MMKIKIKNVYIIILALFLFNCKGKQEKNNTKKQDALSIQQQEDGLPKNKDLKVKEYKQIYIEPETNNVANESKNYFNKGIQLLQKRGFFLMTKQDTQTYLKAAEYIGKAIECDSTYINAYTNLAQIYYKLDSNNMALEVLNSLLEIKPDYVEAITTKGFVLEKIGRQKESNYQYKKALQIYSFRLDKTYSDYINKAFLSLLLYGKEEGLKELEIIKEKYPDKNIEKYLYQFKNFNRLEFIKNGLN